MDRPPADPKKLLAALGEWETGEVPAGRTMGNLKTGGLRDLLEHVAASGEADTGSDHPEIDAGGLLGAWMEWETGATPPVDVLTALHDAGLRALLGSLAAPTG